MSIDPRDNSPKRLWAYSGVVLLILAFVASLAVAVRNTLTVDRPPKPVIMISHWQLEAGYRDALQSVIDSYNALHPDTEIRQTPVGENVYPQWLNTQLVAGTAPDLCEMGKSNLAIKDEYTVKYYVPLSNYVGATNPYNAGTELEGVPWKETLIDGMRGGFREGLQEYYGVPTTLTSMRLFYNKDILKRATGSNASPKTFGEWMVMCDQIRALDVNILPLVSTYSIDAIKSRIDPAFTSSLEPKVDLDLDGLMSRVETYVAYRRGVVGLETPQVLALDEVCRAIGDRMQQGFSSLDRQQGQFRFVNGQAGFMFNGSWDAAGTFLQAKEKGFEVGICDLPPFAPGDIGAEYCRGRASENTSSGSGAYGVYKGSKHIDRAIDFLRYLSSQKVNEKFNQLAQWPPLTVGAQPSELMKPFTPDPRGYISRPQFDFGQLASQALSSNIINYYQGDAPRHNAVTAYNVAITNEKFGGDYAWSIEFAERQRDVRSQEGLLAQQAALDLISPGSVNADRYRRALLQQATRNDGWDYAYLFKKYRGKEMREP